ncbi:MAG: 4-hydroxythreonine-4-phosphate dehydrogenase PdxA [Aquificaceae bacterium]|nr:4-hydroxythreonine-4-phosphate dehydrogenase PdxA [Aquificaceae bacterium]
MRIGITMGDPSGIGPQLCALLLEHLRDDFTYFIFGSWEVFQRALEVSDVKLRPKKVSSIGSYPPGVYFLDLNLESSFEPSLKSAKLAIASLARAGAEALRGNLDGILTMPINKKLSKLVGFEFSGQTEYLANLCGSQEYAMVLYSKSFSVALLTTHVPIRDVPKLLSKELIVRKVSFVLRSFTELFGENIESAILGLNPHSGEDFDVEERQIIIPAIEELKSLGFKLDGPLSPDSAFLKPYKLYFCTYHDQCLIPFKLKNFDSGVNLTLGLKFVRTSPDHGVATDIAWKSRPKIESSLSALRLCEELCIKRAGLRKGD